MVNLNPTFGNLDLKFDYTDHYPTLQNVLQFSTKQKQKPWPLAGKACQIAQPVRIGSYGSFLSPNSDLSDQYHFTRIPNDSEIGNKNPAIHDKVNQNYLFPNHTASSTNKKKHTFWKLNE